MQRNTLFAAGTLALLLGGAIGTAHAQNIVYANEDNFTGYVVSNGGATTAKKNTYLVADDINTIAGSGGLTVNSIDFSLGSNNTAAVSVSPILDFYATDGTGGNPGTLLASIPLNAISLPSGQVGIYTYAPTSGSAFVIPANGSFWAGITFTSTTATAAQLNKVGQGTFNPPTYGTSQDLVFESNGTGTFAASNPAGAQYAAPFEPTVYGSFGWEFETAPVAAAPEPSQYAALAVGAMGLGVLSLKARRRPQAA